MTVEIDEKGGITDKSIENQKEKPLILSKRKTKEKPPKGGKKKGELSFSPSPQKESRMIPPTVEQVAEYCKNRGNSVNAEKFVDFYQSKGWIVGKVKMKDWQASVRTWEKSENYNRPVKTVQKQIIPFPELAKHIIQKEMDWVRKWKSANLRDVEGAMDKVGKYMNDFVNEQKKKGVEGMTIEEFKDKFPLWNRGILEER
ncbi:MAG: hypothetical protein LBE91_08275 [Tannerella sp.]|nr:hypothetical protein [Tannerella sp.]